VKEVHICEVHLIRLIIPFCEIHERQILSEMKEFSEIVHGEV
jgi:hypothetical protein